MTRVVAKGWPIHFRRLLATLLVVGVVQLVVDWLDPFGMGQAAKERAGIVLQRIAAPLYSTSKNETPGQKRVTIVLIDQRYFDTVAISGGGDRKSQWPLPVNTLTYGIIRPIIDADPAALFVDLAFGNSPRELEPGVLGGRKESSKQLGQDLRDLANRRDVPIMLSEVFTDPLPEVDEFGCPTTYLADGEAAERSETSLDFRKALFARDSVDNPFPGNVEMVDSGSISPQGYKLAPRRTGQQRLCHINAKLHNGFVASPALALYRAFGTRCNPVAQDCRAARNFASRIQRAPGPNELGVYPYTVAGDPVVPAVKIDGELSRAMLPRWGVQMSQAMTDAFVMRGGADDCRSQYFGSELKGLKYYFFQIISPIEKLMNYDMQNPCVFIDTISAADLLDQRVFKDENESSFSEKFIEGRIVLLAASISQVGDRFESPVSGDLPGVFQHAVAVENLVTNDGHNLDASGSRWRGVGLFLLTTLLIVAMTELWEAMQIVGRRWFGALGQLLVSPLLYYVLMLSLAGAIYLWLSQYRLPLATMAVPIIALHALFFASWLEILKTWFEKQLQIIFNYAGRRRQYN